MDCDCNDSDNVTMTAMEMEYMKGWDDALKKLFDNLKIVGEAACVLLDFMPSKELTLPCRVSANCVLGFTVKKQ